MNLSDGEVTTQLMGLFCGVRKKATKIYKSSFFSLEQLFLLDLKKEFRLLLKS